MCSPGLDQVPDPVRVVSLVGEDIRACGQIVEQKLGHWCVVHLARRKLDLDWQAVADYPQVQLGGQPSTTSTDTSVSSLFFWAAAC